VPRLKLCGGDPLLDTLRDLYDATPLRVPEDRVQPARAIATNGRRTRIVGPLEDLLVAESESIELPELESHVASLSGKRSRSVDLNVTLGILAGFLPAMGLSLPHVEAVLAGSSSVRFSFPEITRRYVDVTRLGKWLTGRQLDPGNLAAKIFTEQRYELLVIDSVLVSTGFTLETGGDGTTSASLDLGGLEALGAEAETGVKVATTGRDLVFSGPSALTFAFSCVRVFIADHGILASLEPHQGPRTLGFGGTIVETPNHVLLSDEAELFDWSDA
jgi:hypothetical protein